MFVVCVCAVDQIGESESLFRILSVRDFLVARGCSFDDERFVIILDFLTEVDVVCPDDCYWSEGHHRNPRC